MKNRKIWVSNILFYVTIGLILFFDDIHKMTGIPMGMLFFIAVLAITVGFVTDFQKIKMLFSKIFKQKS